MTILILLALCVFMFYRIQVWRDRNETIAHDLEATARAKEELQKEYDFLKETVASWTTKPVYALLTDAQIAEIGKTVGQYIKEPKWLN